MLRAFHSFAFKKGKEQINMLKLTNQRWFSDHKGKKDNKGSTEGKFNIKLKFLSLFSNSSEKKEEPNVNIEESNLTEKKESEEMKATTNTITNTKSSTNTSPVEEEKKITMIKSLKKKPIIMKKASEEDFENEEGCYDLHRTAPKLPPGQPTHKWETFFKRTNSKPFLDIDRAVKNDPDKIYMSFFMDVRTALKSNQYLFAVKNILLNKPKDQKLNLSEFINHMMIFICEQKKIDCNSKLNLLNLLEILHIFPNRSAYFKPISLILEEMSPYYRVHTKHFTLEEYLLLLDVYLTNNIYDAYLVNNFFERFGMEGISGCFSKTLTYKIIYFKNEIKLHKTLFLVLEKYIAYNKMIQLPFEKDFVKQLESVLEKFMTSLSENVLSIADLHDVNGNFANLCSLFSVDHSHQWQRAINNLLLTKINQALDEFYPEEVHLVNSNELLSSISLLTPMHKNYYNEDLFVDTYHKLCYITHSKFQNAEMYNLLYEKETPNWMKENITVKKLFIKLYSSLLEVSIKHKLYNKSVIEPFIILMEHELSLNLTSQKSDLISFPEIWINKLFVLFGQYNFDEVLKKKEVSAKVLDCYFKIIQKIDVEVTKHASKVMDFIHKVPMQVKFDENSEVVVEEDVHSMLKQFYESLSDKVNHAEKNKENKNMFLEDDVLLSDDLGFQVNRVRAIEKKYMLFSHMSDKYNFKPVFHLPEGFAKNDFVEALESWADYLITAINYKLVTVGHCQMFFNFINYIHTIPAIDSEGKYSSIYDTFFKDVLLSNQTIFEKFSKILNFIFFPQNYYNVFENSNKSKIDKDKLLKILKEKYDVEKYRILQSENKRRVNFNTSFKFADKDIFKEAIAELTSLKGQEQTDLEEFLENYYFRNSETLTSAILDDKGYEISIKHLRDKFDNEKGKDGVSNFYYDPDQLLTKENDQNLYVYKTLMDLAKISQTIDSAVVHGEGEDRYLSFYIKKKEEKSELNNVGDINNISSSISNSISSSISSSMSGNQTLTSSRPKFGSMKNISDISSKEILRSQACLEYLLQYYHLKYHSQDWKLNEIKKYKLDKMIDKVVKCFPIYPYFTFYIFSTIQNPDQLNWLTVLNTKYKSTDILDLDFENKISYFKSQYDNILII